MTGGLKFYFPGGRVADTLGAALDFGESFIVATDDHSIVYHVDWAELDDGDRQPLIDLLEKTEAEQALQLIEEVGDLDEVEREMCRQDDELTLIAWTTSGAS